MGIPKSIVNRLQPGVNIICKRKANGFRIVFLLLLLGIGLFAVSSDSFGFDDLALPSKLEFVNVDLRDIFRDLAAIGKFKVLFAHPFQEKATMIIDSGSFIKQTISEIAANHSLTVKWLNSNTAVIGNDSSLSKINTTDINLHVLPLKFIPSISVAKVLETVISSYKIRYDFKANEIAVMANSLELQNITELIHKWDRDMPLINMEIKVVEVTSAFLQAVGLNDSPSTAMKVYPLTEKQMAIIEQNSEKNLLARQEVISLNNQEKKILFGDQIPDVSEESNAEATNYRIGYIDVGTTLDYFARIDHRQVAELLIQLKAKVNAITNTSNTDDKPIQNTLLREVNTTVGLNPGQTIMLTGALKRDEFTRMKTPLYEFSFLDSLFNSALPNSTPAADTTATIIFLTPSLTEKIAYLSKPDLERKQELIIPSIGNQPVTIACTTNIAYTIKRHDTLTRISKKFRVSLQSIIKVNQLKNPGIIKTNSILMIPIPNERIYTVKPKETLWRLAKRYGTTVAVLEDLNSLENVTRIEAGQKLVLPVSAAKIVKPRF
ncbi:MAG: LysM peptidoglycan-binding domain-containing protein [Bacteroidota bacterium]